MLKTHLRFKSVGISTLLFAALLMSSSLTRIIHADSDKSRFSEDILKDPGSLAVKLQDPRAAVSVSIAMQLSADTQQLLGKYDGLRHPSSDLQKALRTDLNRLLQTRSLYNAQNFEGIQLSEQTQTRIIENPQSGEALVRLNRWLLADAYPYELASPSEKQTSRHSEGIKVCRENLRQIKLARDSYRAANADTDPQWLSELSPEYLEKKMLICPADATDGTPGVLTEGGSDPTLPCSYLYEMRPGQKTDHELLQIHEGEMTPIVRCEHHRLNLSISGKLYRNGPQRDIYTSHKTEMALLTDFLQDLRTQHGEAYLKTKEGKEKIKRATEKLVLKKMIPKLIAVFENEIHSQLQAQLGKDILNSPIGTDILKQAIEQAKSQIKEQLQTQLQAQLGAGFFKEQEGKDILQQMTLLLSP